MEIFGETLSFTIACTIRILREFDYFLSLTSAEIVEWKIKWIVPWTMYLHSSHYSLNGFIITKWLHLAILWSWEDKGKEAFDFPQDIGKPRDTWINVWAYGGGRFYIGHSNAKTPSKNSKQINAKVTQLHGICGLQVAATSSRVR